MRKFKEWLNIQLIKNPGGMVLGIILLFNLCFFLTSALVISNFSLSGTEKMSFFEAVFCTITMILDAGCIQFVVADIGAAKVMVVIVCLIIIMIGMISFTGAVIGYITNYISGFIENANTGKRKLKISDHVVILNWNSCASEIVNDLLYCEEEKPKVVVLVNSRKQEILKEIDERLSDTIARENQEILEQCAGMGFFGRLLYIKRNKFKKNVTVIVREGDIFSSKQLNDISLEYARMVVILGNDMNNTMCKLGYHEITEERQKGNSQTVKTLMQVADITAAEHSSDNQKIIVEISDDWTAALVSRIIQRKQVDGKCNIVPVRVNQILGQILSQFSLMPELNLAYRELFSNKGTAFFTEKTEEYDENKYIKAYLTGNNTALPLTFMESKGISHFYYSAASQKDIIAKADVKKSDYKVAFNHDYQMEQKNVIILGHNSRCADIMEGFAAYCAEWDSKDDKKRAVRIVVIDDKKHLEKMDYCKKYPFVEETIVAEIYEQEIICKAIDRFVSSNKEDTSILILSDDSALTDDVDANALANLVYVQDIIREKKEKDPSFDEGKMDVIVEIINPKNHDVVNRYSVNNVVISNRYLSKMITQIGEKEALYDFYTDILTYDTAGTEEYTSKEIYVKKISRLFTEVPGKCTAEELVRAVYHASVDEALPEAKRTPTIVLGYVKKNGKMVLFHGDRSKIDVELTNKDKLIVFSNH